MSIVDSLTCGYAKVSAFSIFSTKAHLRRDNGENINAFKSRDLQFKYEIFRNQFKVNEKFNIERKTFDKNFRKIRENIFSLGKKNAKSKLQVLNYFSLENWNKLPAEVKQCHSLIDCIACTGNQSNKEILSMIPSRSRCTNLKASQVGLHSSENKVLLETTASVLNSVNNNFVTLFDVSFKDAQNLLLGQEAKADKQTRKKKKIKLANEVRKNIELQFEETSIQRYF